MNFYQFLVPRLEGAEIEKDFALYAELTRKGVAGFIVFGGEVESLREGISRLQGLASMPLIIASDLEQGLGQQIRGGTLFPPAAAIARAEESCPGNARRIFECIARESSYAGINTIFAPVLDVNTNPENPIISTRAFSEEPETVSSLGQTMIKTFLENGIVPCGKHFPGHGSTGIDSHLALPRIEKSLEELEACELKPFRTAIASGVPMIMLGHLSVPALDPEGVPVSVSKEAVIFLRERMGFHGIAITDAMNMGGLASFKAADASLKALEAGVDLLLHTQDPERLTFEIERSGKVFGSHRVETFRKALSTSAAPVPASQLCQNLSLYATQKAIRVKGELGPLKNPFVLVFSDGDEDGSVFIEALRDRYPSLTYRLVTGKTDHTEAVPSGRELIVAVFSSVKAFKGGCAPWLRDAMRSLNDRVRVAVSFGGPQLVVDLGETVPKLYAWWGSEAAQLEVAKALYF